MPSTICPVLICGGNGTRLWPLSRKSCPKQFVQLAGTQSLFQTTVHRFNGDGFALPLVVTGSNLRFIAVQQLAALEIPPCEILVEPCAKNTAAAICAAALSLETSEPGALMLVAPADHVIPDAGRFRAAVTNAVPEALAGQLVTFGIRPDRPETGYGWLEPAEMPDAGGQARPLNSFVEKPDPATAQGFLDGGRHLWNAGIFLFTTTAILEAFAAHAPATLAGARTALENARHGHGFIRLAPEPWGQLEDISIDNAVMEKADNLSVISYGGAWCDLGDWQSVWRNGNPDGAGNVTSGAATALDCADTLLQTTADGQHLVGIGLENIVAIAMPDAVLVADRDRVQDVKRAVEQLRARGVAQAETMPHDIRPWGLFEKLFSGPLFQVKRIVVHPGECLSLQSHHHRAEHWIVVEGAARVTIGELVKVVLQNQSVYIPAGEVHRLENPGEQELTLIEVQTGSYFGEDDIVRYDDDYGRSRYG